MDQEEKMDFKALRAKFQDEERPLKQSRIKPALPEKPKSVPPSSPPPPPPQSPTHYLPAGARPSLLTSINQTLEGKTTIAPRVVFKEEEESKKTKKDKSGGKLKKGKDKPTKGSKEKLSEDPKQRNDKDKKVSTAELVPATPPPKATTGKKGFLGFRKAKRDSMEVQVNPILDTPSADNLGQAPLFPLPPDSGDTRVEQETSAPKALLPNIPTIPDAGLPVEIAPLSIPDCPACTPPPAFIPDNPTPAASTPVSKTVLPEETASLQVSIPARQSETTPSPTSVSTRPPSQTISSSPSVGFTSSPSPAEPERAAEAAEDEVEAPLPSVLDPFSVQSSPKATRSISALSALERAEDMSPGKRTPLCDLRVFNALEKARRKPTSQQNNPSTSNSTLPSGDLTSPTQSPTSSLPVLPPIDYEDRLRNAPLIPVQMNGLAHGQASPVLDDITEENPDAILEMLVVPPPPPRKFLPDPDSLGAAPEKPARPPSVDLSHFLPPQLDNTEIPPPPQFSETGSTDIPVFEDLGSEAPTPELPVSDWGSRESIHLDSPDGHNIPGHFSNGLIIPTAEAHLVNQDTPLAESSFSTSQASPSHPGLQDQDYNGISESTDALSEGTSKSRKKVKTDGGKKRKGPPKNPYAETPQESNEEKSKTGRFGKNDKKAEDPDEKELKKKEKQRLEKEKKELKEKQERERKEQKEREKKENEMKKKFKITGQEETLYQATVLVTAKGRKHDLPVKTGDHVSIIRTTNCPKGKWLARDGSNNYGYVSVEHVELDIKEMLELGKKAANTHKSSTTETDCAGNRMSNHFPMSDSFTDDSEEWTGDEEELPSPLPQSEDPLASVAHTRTLSMPDVGIKDLSVNHQHSHSDISADNSNVHARQEALQKLATFFYSTKPVEPAASSTEPKKSPLLVMDQAVDLPGAASSQEMDLKASESDMIILPPPDLYADLTEA